MTTTNTDRIAPWTPSGDAWGGLARDIIMWHDIYQERTPRSLLKHLDRVGAEIPMWLLDEPEMKSLDNAISKGTRAVIIYRAMLQDAQAATAPAPSASPAASTEALTETAKRIAWEVNYAIDGVSARAEDVEGLWDRMPEANRARYLAAARAAAPAAESVDRLPAGHIVLEQADMPDGRVSQTVQHRDGSEYQRIVSADEAYGLDEDDTSGRGEG